MATPSGDRPPQSEVVQKALRSRVDYARRVITNDRDQYQLHDDYFQGAQAHPFIPKETPAEMKELNKRSVTNLMRIAVKIPSSLVHMDACVRNKDTAPAEWKRVSETGFYARQQTLNTAALKYGQVFVGLEELGEGKPTPKIYATKNTCAVFKDPVNDIHPLYLLTILNEPLDEHNPGAALYMDAERVVHFEVPSNEGDWKVTSDKEHLLPVCPAVRYVVDLDDEGRVTGAIEPLVTLQDAVNQGKRNLLRNNNYSAEKVRYASGVVGELERDESGAIVRDVNGDPIQKPVHWNGQRAITTGAPDAKFGAIDETPADGFILTMEELIREFAVVAQIPPHALLGNLSNLSAETLVAALGQTMRLVHGLQSSWGEAHRALLRLVAIDIGEITAEDDYDAEVQWRDMSDRSFGAVVDALGKMAQMLGIPMKALWRWVPNVTGGELDLWEDMQEEDQQVRLEQALDNPMSPAAGAAREARPRPGRGVTDGANGVAGARRVAPGSSS